MQQTLQNSVTCHGVGLHSGQTMTLTLHPAPADSGIVFVRTDLAEGENEIPALWDRVVDTRLCTVIANDSGASVGTIEHLMAALRGAGINNIRIEINGAEVPIMDGSALPFLAMIDEAGIEIQNAPQKALKILKEVRIETEDGKIVELRPSDIPVYKGDIEFSHPDIGSQSYNLQLLNGNFRHDVADCRTFGFKSEVEYLRAQGLARGGSLDNAIVLDDTSILNPGGLRRSDEFIRHKLLDAVGDLYLAGAPILGEYYGRKAGHALNNQILRALFATPGAAEMVDLGLAPEETRTRAA